MGLLMSGGRLVDGFEQLLTDWQRGLLQRYDSNKRRMFGEGTEVVPGKLASGEVPSKASCSSKSEAGVAATSKQRRKGDEDRIDQSSCRRTFFPRSSGKRWEDR